MGTYLSETVTFFGVAFNTQGIRRATHDSHGIFPEHFTFLLLHSSHLARDQRCAAIWLPDDITH
jgi:hypothetical protein